MGQAGQPLPALAPQRQQQQPEGVATLLARLLHAGLYIDVSLFHDVGSLWLSGVPLEDTVLR